MAKNYFVSKSQNDLEIVFKHILSWFFERQYKVDHTEVEGNYVIQAQKTGTLRTLTGTNLAFAVKLYWSNDSLAENEFVVETSVGKWISNLAGAGLTAMLTSGVTVITGLAGAGWALVVEKEIIDFIEKVLKFEKIIKNLESEANSQNLEASSPLNTNSFEDQTVTTISSTRQRAIQKVQEYLDKLESAYNAGILTEAEFYAKKAEAGKKIDEYEIEFTVEEKLQKLEEAFAQGLLNQQEYDFKVSSIHNTVKEELLNSKSNKAEKQQNNSTVESTNKNRFKNALSGLGKIISNSEFYTEIQKGMAEQKLQQEQKDWQSAYNLADNSDFKGAIAKLKKISESSDLYTEAQSKIVEYQWRQEQQYFIDAASLADNQKFKEAIIKLQNISSTSDVYTNAQKKIAEYQKQEEQQYFTAATNLVENQQFKEAIIKLKQISSSSDLYTEAQSKIAEYQWRQEQQYFIDAASLADNQKFKEAIIKLQNISSTSDVYTNAQKKIAEYRKQEEQQYFIDAASLADNQKFKEAIIKLQSISSTSDVYTNAQKKIAEYQRQQQQEEVKAAYKLATNKNFQDAIAKLKKIPANSDLYTEAQSKIAEYQQQQYQQDFIVATNIAGNKQLKDAIIKLQKIPSTSNVYTKAQEKIVEYRQEEEYKKYLDVANNLEKNTDYNQAVTKLANIPSTSIWYTEAQSKIANYKKQLHEIEEQRKQRTVESGGRSIEVTNVYALDSLSINNPFTEKITGKIVVVDMNFSNTSKKSGNFMFSTFELIDSQECTYKELVDMTYTLWRQEKGFGSRTDDYFPGEVRREVAAFRVSPTASGFTLIWNGKRIKL